MPLHISVPVSDRVRAYLSAWVENRDPRHIRRIYTEDATVRDPGILAVFPEIEDATVRGGEQIQEFARRAQEFPEVDLRVVCAFDEGAFSAIEWESIDPQTGTSVAAAEIFEWRGHKIKSVHVYVLAYPDGDTQPGQTL